MKGFVKILLVVLFSVFATSPQEVSASMAPFGVNDTGIDPGQGTAAAAQVFRDVADLEKMESGASEFISPAWMEILVLVSPANFPITTFLTQKVLDGVRGLAKSEASKTGAVNKDYLVKTPKGEDRFNMKYRIDQKRLQNYNEFGDADVKNYKLSWGEISVIPFQDKATGTFAGGATTGTVTVANIGMWTRNCLLKVQNKSYAGGEELVVFVNNVNVDTNTLTLVSLGGGDGSEDIPALAVNDQFTRMGTSFAELDVKNDAVSQHPVSDYNFAQKFITSVVYSNWLSMTQLFTNYSYSLITNLALQDFRYGQELSFMFGLRSEITVTKPGGGNEVIRTTGGLRYFVDQEIEYGTGGGDKTIAEADIVDITKQMRVGNNGSDTRYLYAGSELIAALNKGIMSDSTRFVQKDYDTVYGLSFTVLYSFFGTINIMYAPLMDQSEYIDRGFLLDMQFVDKFVFQPFRETNTDLVKLRDADAKSVDMVETCGMIVRNTDTQFVLVVKA